MGIGKRPFGGLVHVVLPTPKFASFCRSISKTMNGCGFSSPNKETKIGLIFIFLVFLLYNLVDENQEQLI